MSGFPNGTRVKISGLAGKVELNGREATIVKKDEKNAARFIVDVDGAGEKSLKPDNLSKVQVKPDPPELGFFLAGTRVVISGLTGALQELNGKEANVVCRDNITGVYTVEIDDFKVLLKPEYLSKVFLAGTRVVIGGLTGAPGLNGKEANVVSKDNNTGRYTVEIDGVKVVLKPENLSKVASVCHMKGPDGADLSKGITLAGNSKCPFAQRAWFALEESGLKYTRYECELFPKPQWLLDMNPLGKVPVFVEDGKVLVGSSAIVELIAAKAREKIPGSDEVREKKWRTIMEEELRPAWLSWNKSQVRVVLEKLNLLLADPTCPGPFITGASLSIADILAAPELQRVFEDAGWTWPRNLSKMKAWWTAISEREAFQKTTLSPGNYWSRPPLPNGGGEKRKAPGPEQESKPKRKKA